MDDENTTKTPAIRTERKERVPKADLVADQLATTNKLLADILQHQADEIARNYTDWQFRMQVWAAVRTKLRKGKRPEQQALCEMLDSLL